VVLGYACNLFVQKMEVMFSGHKFGHRSSDCY